jgi:hypothetical protein
MNMIISTLLYMIRTVLQTGYVRTGTLAGMRLSGPLAITQNTYFLLIFPYSSVQVTVLECYGDGGGTGGWCSLINFPESVNVPRSFFRGERMTTLCITLDQETNRLFVIKRT